MGLAEKIVNRKAKLGIIGLGYVGLPLALEFARVGFEVVGIDINQERNNAINSGKSYIPDVDNAELSRVVTQGKLRATNDFSEIQQLDTINICVPTPLRKTKDPDVSFIVNATTEIANFLHQEQLIILESTTYPGTTEELLLPMLNKKGAQVGKDFFLAFSPERVDPGNAVYTTKNVPKVVGGVTPECTQMAKLFYKQCLEQVVAVSSPRVAEMVKLLENTFRIVNIGLVNEIALMSHELGIDAWEVIDAAATKPFGFMPFYPGPGLGGHCIPVDPFYLSWKARLVGFEARFIELAGEINRRMPYYVVSRIGDALNKKQKSIKGSKIFIVGVAYKSNINDVREAPALDVMRILLSKEANLAYSDPYVPELTVNNHLFTSQPLTSQSIREKDCVVIITPHDVFDYQLMVANASLIFDTRNALKGITDNHIIKL